MERHTLATLAAEALTYFTTGARDNGETFRHTTDDRPEWLRDLIYAAHGDMLPDDWRYEAIHTALCDVSDMADDATADDARDMVWEWLDSAVSIYTHDLTGWLHSRADRYGYVDGAIEEFGRGASLTDDLQAGQAAELREVYAAVIDALEATVEEMNA